MKKKFISLLTALSMTLMLFTGVPISVSAEAAASGTCGTDLTWSLENGVLTISGTGAMTDYGINSNFAPWYGSKENITSVKIESGVTSIGKGAFFSCSNATSVDIPESVTSIGVFI